MLQRIRMGRLWIDVVDFAGALAIIEKRIQSRAGGTIFTPNVDHVVGLSNEPARRALYEQAWLTLNDSAVLQRLAKKKNR